MRFRANETDKALRPDGTPLSAPGHFDLLDRDTPLVTDTPKGERLLAKEAAWRGVDLMGNPLIYASPTRRILANIIDLLLLSFFFSLSILAYSLLSNYGFNLSLVWRDFTNPGTAGAVDAFGYLIFVTFVIWLYFPLMQATTGQATIGMQFMGLRLVADDLRTMSFANSFWRHIIFTLIYLTGILPIFNLIIMHNDLRHQGLHDKAVNSLYLVE